MPKLKPWICSALLAVVSVAPVLAGTKDATDAKTTAETTANPAAQPAPAAATPNITPVAGNTNVTALLGVLVMKGVLTTPEAKSIEAAPPGAEFQALVDALARKGVVSASDLTTAAATLTPAAAPAAASPAAPEPQAAAATPAPKPAAPAVVAAITPLRVLPYDPPKPGGLVGLKVGALTFAPYGFIKATAAHDTSSPNGDDFPIVAGLMLLPGSNTGPTAGPEFHMKARASRMGLNIEWPDMSPNLVLTGRIEADFEGNFNEADNSDVTSIRSPNVRLRLAYVRLDYRSSGHTNLWFVGGQDWTLFGSKALPNLLETTWLGANYGVVYNRSPQFRIGLAQKFGDSPSNFKLSPEFAIMMPSSGQVEKLSFCTLAGAFCPPLVSQAAGFLNQIGEAERQGADSNRPEYEAGLTAQFQLDKAPAVAPAQIFWSGFYGKRSSIVTNTATDLFGNAYPTALVAGTQFAKGFTATSAMYGNQIGIQLPTRWFTLVASVYKGADLRQVLGGQLTTDYSNALKLFPLGLSNGTGYFSGTGVDNVAGVLSGFALLGCTVNPGAGTCPSGNIAVAPQHGVQAYGGFFELGLPLSRWANANPKGHNAGWQLYLHAGKERLRHSDALMQLGVVNGVGPNQVGQGLGIPMIGSDFAGATLYYKLNPWCTFGFEQTHYSSRAIPELGNFWTIAASPNRIWQDQRTEFGPVFTF